MRIMNKTLIDYITIMLGTFLVAVAITVFFEPNDMVTGGVSGLAIIILDWTKHLGFPIPLWISNLVLNIPLFILGTRARGFHFLAKTSFATAFLSVTLFVTSYLPAFGGDLLLCAVYGGVITGVGLGLVFRAMATTGGTDMAASIINKYLPHFSMQRILFCIDSTIIAIGFFVFGPTTALYAIISVFISTKVLDTMLEGLNFSKAAFIISDHSDEISKTLLSDLERGVTSLSGHGMFTGNAKNVLLCVVSTTEIVKLKDLVYNIDHTAFVIVADVREVLGEGFKSI